MSEIGLGILNSLSSGILAVDLEYRVLFINRVFALRAGLCAEDWLGRPLDELTRFLSPRLVSGDPYRWPDAKTTDVRSRRCQVLDWTTETGDVVHVREDAGPLRDSAGRVVGRLFAYHDMSRERAIDRMKTEFIAVASHELRTPMTSIKGSIDLLLSGFAGSISSEAEELLEIAQKGCERLIRLINDILDLAKIEAGQIRLKMLKIDLVEPVNRSIRGVKAFADQNQVRLRLDKPDVLPAVEADKDRIEQVVTNLLSNAIKYSPANGEVCVELVTGDGWVQCAVIDHGPGIPEHELKRVFEKFQQVADSRRKSGTGLGLAIAQALVNEHRGRLWVESIVNEGSRFIFRLPATSS